MLLLYLRIFNETKTKSNIVVYKYMYVYPYFLECPFPLLLIGGMSGLVLLQSTGMHLLLE